VWESKSEKRGSKVMTKAGKVRKKEEKEKEKDMRDFPFTLLLSFWHALDTCASGQKQIAKVHPRRYACKVCYLFCLPLSFSTSSPFF
jgi:hypothetical protein